MGRTGLPGGSAGEERPHSPQHGPVGGGRSIGGQGHGHEPLDGVGVQDDLAIERHALGRRPLAQALQQAPGPPTGGVVEEAELAGHGLDEALDRCLRIGTNRLGSYGGELRAWALPAVGGHGVLLEIEWNLRADTAERSPGGTQPLS